MTAQVVSGWIASDSYWDGEFKDGLGQLLPWLRFPWFFPVSRQMTGHCLRAGFYCFLSHSVQSVYSTHSTNRRHFCEPLRMLFFLWRYSPNLCLGLPPWNPPFHFGFLDLRQSVGFLGQVISSSQGLYLYTNTEKRARTHTHTHTHTHTKHPCPEWNSNPRSRLPSERRQKNFVTWTINK
jgi:hypothetical protein